MSNSRTQHRAECAHCGRDHAVRCQAMVAHGYTVPTGWHQFVGECPGTGKPHFGTPEGRDHRAAIGRAFADDAEALRMHALAVREGSGEVRAWQSYRLPSGKFKSEYLPVAEPTAYQRRDWAAHLDHKAQSAQRTADDIARTVREWQAREPRAVVIEAKPVVIHLATDLYRMRDIGACVASAMGAQRFAGRTTRDHSEVTCARCLKDIERMKQIEAKRAAKIQGASE